MKSIRIRLLIRISILLFILFLINQILEYKSFREVNINHVKNQSFIVAEIVRDSLTTLMEIGKIDKRELLLNNIKLQHRNIEEIRVVRGDKVIQQYGEGREEEKPKTEAELKVLQTGKPYERLDERFDKVSYVLIIPYKAEPIGKINCLKCHNVEAGSVLGAVYIKTDLTPVRSFAFSNLVQTTLMSMFIFLMTVFVIMKFFHPYTDFFAKLKRGLKKAKDGDFSERVFIDTNDEAREVADTYNETMDKLCHTLTAIEKRVSYLIDGNIQKSSNALKDTYVIVEELVKIYNFKKIVEKDASKDDIYLRLRKLMKDMGIRQYSIYEVDYENNRLIDIDEDEKWCKDIVFTNADQCRVKRTGSEVVSEEYACVCPNFIKCENGEADDFFTCIPIYVGGRVGIILQLIYNRENKEDVKGKLPFLEAYLREVAPVIEAKSYMEKLKKQSLVDQLTGLYNRRFLEEIIPKLSQQVIRRNSNIGILMIDIDFFKQINDKYGHDVGDIVLKKVADVIRNTVREADIVIRYGGEEFMVLLIDVQEGKSEEIAEKIRKRVENTVINTDGISLKKTVSIGVSEFPKDSDRFWQCIKFSDVALYKAKESGRNMVVRFRKEMWEREEY
ncbi:diguanylate cyclase [Persephonella atlantica]|uniref:Diguanylate cyclase n=1 Tax=Persephonella atlantica TaxID=2699429 RepID=A0ABS1GFE3_9AQUI|nr:diguanylate cyclase [Persephonella atlantica]MBK3331586.1 diguanylate cyclase [Persephonella atlantica]